MIMEDGAFTPNNNNNNNNNSINNSISIDFNLMDELLYDGFWLETTTTTSTEDGSSNFWPSHENLNPTSFFFPTSDDTNSTNTNPPQPQESFLNPQTDVDSSSKEHQAQITHQQLDIIPASVSDVNKRLWVGPNKNPTVKKRLLQAINQLKDSIRDKDVLIQIWVPVKRGGKQVLTTNNQPFSLNPSCKNLADYRDASRTYQFAADKDSKENVQGLPGRVFLKKLPEWTPDVRFFKSEEYPRVAHAQQYDVRGSLALPVFEQASGNCLGVVEIVTTTQRVDYRPELETVCKALEAVHLKSSNVPSPPNVENCNEPYQAALAEIRNVLKCVCDTHNLPLAQTWAPCIQQGKGGCRHSDENYAHCVSTVDSACYVADTQVSGFHEACSEHHLLKGEGIAGKAFWTNQPCFSQDIKAFRKTEYPLAHHATVFNLCAAVAIRLRSIYTGKADFVLEFFLPLNYKDEEDQRLILLDSLSSVIEQTCQSLRVVTDQELAQETYKGDDSSSSSSSWITHMMMDPKKKGKGVTVSLGGKQHKVEPEEEFKVTTTQWDNNSGLDLDENFSLAASGHLSLASAKRSSEKRRAKTEKAIGLEVLRQYFAGSLKDAARSIGVCPTTLKRICRHHGITRWPSRKIKKVGHSLKKLQLVIDSVQGAEGSIQLSSFYNNFPELVSSPNVPPGSSHSPTSKMIGHLPEKSPSSSDSHSSSSSYCVSTGVKQSSDFPVNGDALSEEQTKGGGGGGGGGMLKRARSDAKLHDLGQEETKQQLLVRSYSHKIFSTQNTNAPVVPKSNTTNVETFKVKATFGEEKVRLSMQPNWDFKYLQQEVLRRFNIDIGIRMDLKYLDDDAEWVLLTCDADLEECIDIHRSCKSRTIKISVNQAASYHPSLGSSFGSNGPF